MKNGSSPVDRREQAAEQELNQQLQLCHIYLRLRELQLKAVTASPEADFEALEEYSLREEQLLRRMHFHDARVREWSTSAYASSGEQLETSIGAALIEQRRDLLNRIDTATALLAAAMKKEHSRLGTQLKKSSAARLPLRRSSFSARRANRLDITG